jgi:hypothetical protein
LTSRWVVERCKERNYYQRVPARGTLFSPLNGRKNNLPLNKEKEIKTLYALLLKKVLNADTKDDKDPELVRILVAAKTVLRDAY